MRIMLKDKDFDPMHFGLLQVRSKPKGFDVNCTDVLKTYIEIHLPINFREHTGAKLFQSAHIADWVKEIKKKITFFCYLCQKRGHNLFLEGVFFIILVILILY